MEEQISREQQGQQLALVIPRLLLAPIFISAGLGHLLNPGAITARLDGATLGYLATWLAPSQLLVLLSGAVMLVAGLSLMLGLFTRLSATVLALVLIPITVTIQIANPAGYGPFFKNVVIFGGLIHFAILGAQTWSLDGLLTRPGAKAMRIRRSLAALMVLMVGAGSACSTLAHAGTAEDSKPALSEGEGRENEQTRKVVSMAQNPRPLKNVLETGSELAKQGAQVSVIACDMSMRSLLQQGENVAVARSAKESGVRVLACGLTLRELQIDESELLDGLEVVQNGLLEIIRLQEQGYLSVQL